MSAHAQGDVPKPPEDPAAAKVYRVFEQACASCHQSGQLKGMNQPAGSFGNILDLDALRANPARIIPGNPEASKVFTMIAARAMPPDTAAESAEIGVEQLDAVREWIVRLGTEPVTCTAAAPRRSGRDIARSATAFLETLDAAKAKTVRLLTLSAAGERLRFGGRTRSLSPSTDSYFERIVVGARTHHAAARRRRRRCAGGRPRVAGLGCRSMGSARRCLTLRRLRAHTGRACRAHRQPHARLAW